MKKAIFCVIAILGGIPSMPSYAQEEITTPDASPAAEVKQTIGISEVTVTYHRPAVKGRKIWGNLVSYGFSMQMYGNGNPAPWRAGADENTTITFSDDATVEGHKVPAGTYGLFFVINEDNSGVVILSRRNRAWGSFFYNEADDLMRANIRVRDNAFTEMLTYDFINLTKNRAELVLNWEKKQFPITIEFPVDELVIANAKEELSGALGFTVGGYVSAAKYSFENNADIEQGKKWIDQALAMEPTNFQAIRVKSRFLNREGKQAEADQMVNNALQTASENQINEYGYNLLLALGLHDKAIKVFKVGTERFPLSANAWDSLGEAYMVKGDKDKAIPCFKKVLSLNPPPNVKANSEKYLTQLGATK